MRTLVTADLHLHDNQRDLYRFDFVEKELPRILKDHECKKLILLGDIAHEKDHHGAWLVNRIARAINNLSKIVPIIILKGNHDYTDPTNPFYAFLGMLDNVKWIGTPTELLLDDVPALFLPHTNDFKNNFPKKIKHTLIFAHQTFQGANVGPRKLDGIPLDIFPPHARIFSGDVHVPQKIKGPQDQTLWYTGAPYRINFGDAYQPRVIILEGTKPYSVITDCIYKHLIEIDRVEKLKNFRNNLSPGDIIKVCFHLKTDDFEKWHNYKAAIENWIEQHECICHMVSPIVEQHIATKRLESFERKSDKVQIKEYAKRRKASEAVLQFGLDLAEK